MALRTLARRGLEETVVRARGGGATTTATTGTSAGAWLRFRSDDATTTTTTTTGEAGTREANATAEAKATIETLGSEGAPTEERKTRRRKPPTKETAAAGKDGGATSAKKKRAKKLELSMTMNAVLDIEVSQVETVSLSSFPHEEKCCMPRRTMRFQIQETKMRTS